MERPALFHGFQVMISHLRHRLTRHVLLIVTLCVGFALRLYGLNWDQGYGLHPDERYITWVAASIHLPSRLSEVVQAANSPLNPYRRPPGDKGSDDSSRSFSYGHLPLYLMVVASAGDGDEERLALVGRVLSALFDTTTILLTFALGRLLYDARVGVLASILVALTVMHIQLAHYATFDMALTCFVIATLLFSARLSKSGRRSDALLAGLSMGCAVGSKSSAMLLLAPLLVAHATCRNGPLMKRNTPARSHSTLPEAPLRPWLHNPKWMMALTLLAACLAFGLTNPYSLLQPDELFKNLSEQGAMLRGGDSFPFTGQYQGTSPYIYQVEQQLRWGMGLALGLAGFGGFLYALISMWRSHCPPENWVLLLWTVFYLGFVGSLYVKFMRYVLPASPALAIFAAALIQVCASRVRECRRSLPVFPDLKRVLAVAPAALVIVPTLVYALAFLNVFRGEHPWLRFSRRIYDVVSAGSTIAYERWDHQLPLMVIPGEGEVTNWPGQFHQQVIDAYVPDSPVKLTKILDELAVSDYLIVASNRIYGSIARCPTQYPLMARYYELLFSGQLGFRLVVLPEIERHPRIGPLALVADPFDAVSLSDPFGSDKQKTGSWTLNPGPADESFTVYDHPRPLLFQNDARLSTTDMQRLFSDLLDES